jgi:hypothetical protein
MDTAFIPTSGPAAYRLNPGAPTTAAPTDLTAMATPAAGAAAAGSVTSLSNPLTWFAVLAAVTLGLAAISTSVRVGPGRAALSLGQG